MSEYQIIEFLQNHRDWLSHATFWQNIAQMTLFGILRVLYQVAIFAENVVDTVFLASDFFNNEAITMIFNGMLVFTVSLTALTLIIIAVRRMVNKKIEMKGPLIRAVIYVMLIGTFPSILRHGLDVAIDFYGDASVIGNDNHTRITTAIIRENVADMHYLSYHGFHQLDSPLASKNNLTDETFFLVDFTEVITPDDIDRNSQLQPLLYTLDFDSEFNIGVTRINNSWMAIFDEGYFRWTANWGNLFVTLPTITIFMLCVAFILLATILDLIFLKFLVPILAPTDLETGQKMKHIAKDISASLISIVMTGFSLSIFRILMGLIFSFDLNPLGRLIFITVAITTCASGSKAVGKYLGVETGMSGGLKSLMKLGATGFVVARGSTALSKGVTRVAKGSYVAAKASGNIANKVTGLALEKTGQTIGEIGDLGVKDFMKSKMHSTTNGIVNAGRFAGNKIKSGVNQVGGKYQDGVNEGIIKVSRYKGKQRKTQADKDVNERLVTNAETVKDKSADSAGFKIADLLHHHQPTAVFENTDIPHANPQTVVDSSKDITIADIFDHQQPQIPRHNQGKPLSKAPNKASKTTSKINETSVTKATPKVNKPKPPSLRVNTNNQNASKTKHKTPTIPSRPTFAPIPNRANISQTKPTTNVDTKPIDNQPKAPRVNQTSTATVTKPKQAVKNPETKNLSDEHLNKAKKAPQNAKNFKDKK